MTTATLRTQVVDHGHEGDLKNCPVFRMMPADLREKAEAFPPLMDYLHVMPVEELGIPKYVPELSRKMGDLKNPNIIYPVRDHLFVHIYPDAKDSRNVYASIEPGMFDNVDEVIQDIELRFLGFVHELEAYKSVEERRAILLSSLDRVVEMPWQGKAHASLCKVVLKLRSRLAGNNKKLVLTKKQYDAVRYRLERDKIGMGVLEPLLQDSNIEDISCSGLGFIFIEHKVFRSVKSNISFHSMEELDHFVVRMSEKIGRPVTFREPVVDSTLPDGSRINIVFGGDVSKRGSNFTIRKFADDPMSIVQLVEFGSLSWQMAAYLFIMLQHGMNMFVAGETASGKTTLMNALTTFIKPNAKIVSIEDTPELQVPHPNWIREVVRGTSKQSQASSVTMFDLLKAALRQRPNEIIIGEIRGEEGAIAFQAMQTGHSAMATFHASTVERLIQRLTGDPINVPKNYIDNLNLVVIQSAVQLPDGKQGRRTTSISEIIGYDPVTQGFAYVEIFRWNPATDTFEYPGYMNSPLLEERISLMRGIAPAQKRSIYEEVERRATILERLSQKGVRSFRDVYSIIAQAYRRGLIR
ncbi:MAG: type II/IV secretion system ATPase subunit [Chloroflexi bacterium]|nr:type II/IV secretion system ATPase subunit [Chloroflexota bacterium]